MAALLQKAFKFRAETFLSMVLFLRPDIANRGRKMFAGFSFVPQGTQIFIFVPYTQS
jgi:hypothetical protein